MNGIMIHFDGAVGSFVPAAGPSTSFEARWLVIMTWIPGRSIFSASSSDTIGGPREE